ncbi:hypothetical protein [Dryocola sp. BD613]|uniref:hypothetical protein n=1 Tax=Dryocola sp. BD613 TaxID=3133272 RepID=UPI003F4FBC55
MSWFGCVGCGVGCLLFYYLPVLFGAHFDIAVTCSLVPGLFISLFASVTALLPAQASAHKGVSNSIYNLAAGMSNFVARAIATWVLQGFGVKGIVIIWRALFFAALVIFIIGGKETEPLSEQINSGFSESR